MTNPKKIYSFLKSNRLKGYCDDCLQKKTGVDRHEINTIASTLAFFPSEFSRSPSSCPQQCSARDKIVTTAL